ncbi:hypothetical protein [Agromyces silvae]|uniref:hypothetical protein n=1 Tax=Agromyces silvae TaxID=3388266 RepID=UPI00280B7F2A|nr:hypothetical protein [Agromyces protaetiae]
MTGMFTWLYDVSGSADSAREAIREVLQQQGFDVDEATPAEWHAQYGTQPSFMQQMFTNAHKPVLLSVLFTETDSGVEIELKRPTLYGVGGSGRDNVELMHLDKEYRATAAAVHERLAAEGVLISSRE